MIMFVAMSLAAASMHASADDCPPPCQAPNPDYDPNDPYETDPPCIPKPDGPIDGEPCKECKGGEVVEKPLLCYEIEEKGEEKTYGCNCSEGKGNDFMPTCSSRINTFKYYEAKESCKGFATTIKERITVWVERPCKTSYDWTNMKQVPAGICLASCVAAALLKSPSGAAECLVCLHDNFKDFDPCDYLKCELDNEAVPFVVRKTSHTGGLTCD
jgi:hypothetical protein